LIIVACISSANIFEDKFEINLKESSNTASRGILKSVRETADPWFVCVQHSDMLTIDFIFLIQFMPKLRTFMSSHT